MVQPCTDPIPWDDRRLPRSLKYQMACMIHRLCSFVLSMPICRQGSNLVSWCRTSFHTELIPLYLCAWEPYHQESNHWQPTHAIIPSRVLTQPTWVLIEKTLLSVPASIILLTTIFSVPRIMPFLHLTPRIVLHQQSMIMLTKILKQYACTLYHETYLEPSTAFSAYSIWKILPSGDSDEHS